MRNRINIFFLVLLGITGCKQGVPVVPTAPPITVIPSATNITTAKPLSIIVSASGTPTPTGTVEVTSGTAYASSIKLSNGTAVTNIPANTLLVGIYTFIADYTPDSTSSSIYTTSSGYSTPVTVVKEKGIVVPWQLPIGCTLIQPCKFWVYRIPGTCPTNLSGSSGWTLITVVNQETFYTDTSVTSGIQYSYVVESGVGNNPTSGPSLCSTFTAP